MQSKSSVYAILFFLELPRGVEAGLQVSIDGRRGLVLLVLRQPSRLIALKAGHGPVELLVDSQKFSLGLVVDVNILGVDLS